MNRATGWEWAPSTNGTFGRSGVLPPPVTFGERDLLGRPRANRRAERRDRQSGEGNRRPRRGAVWVGLGAGIAESDSGVNNDTEADDAM